MVGHSTPWATTRTWAVNARITDHALGFSDIMVAPRGEILDNRSFLPALRTAVTHSE
jgi:hypothetical protein